MKILLTGEVQVGKSTIIRKVTERHPDWKIGGFVTVKAPKGAQIPQNWPEGQEFLPDAVYICRAGKPLFSSMELSFGFSKVNLSYLLYHKSSVFATKTFLI